MIKIMFVCLGNICRSPMAEFVFRDLVQKKGLERSFCIASSATSREELGSPVHFGTKTLLSRYHISCAGKTARLLEKSDYEQYDLFIGMEQRNLKNMQKILGPDPFRRLHLLLDFTSLPGDIADPWYTHNFEKTYQDILLGCHGLFEYLCENHRIC